MYADYSYYADHYGGDIPEREYPSAERRAEAYIRKLTYVRGNIFAVENTAVKDRHESVRNSDLYAWSLLIKRNRNHNLHNSRKRQSQETLPELFELKERTCIL